MVNPPNGSPGTTAATTTAHTVLHTTESNNASTSTRPSHSQPRRSKPASSSNSAQSNIPLSARRADRLDMESVERKGKQREPVIRTHMNGIPEAPTFRPTEEEWKDPIEYIRKISSEGKKYGIVKLVPPESWKPDFAIDTERFHFHTRKQELNSVEGGTRANLSYLDQLAKFHKSQGMNLNRFPSVDKRPLDLYELKKAVESRGGFDSVCKGKKWAEIGRDLGYSGKIMSSLSTSLKNSYAKWLDPYEQFLLGAKPSVQMQLEQERGGPYGTPSPNNSPMRKSAQQTPSNLSRDSPTARASQALNESVNEQVNAPKPAAPPLAPSAPTSGFTPVNSGFKAVNASSSTSSFTAAKPTNGVVHRDHDHKPTLAPAAPNGHPSSGAGANNGHSVFIGTKPLMNGQGSQDLKRRLSDSPRNEADRNGDASRKSKRVKKEGAPTVTGSHMMQPRASTPRPFTSRDRNNMKPGDFCEVCGKGEDDKNILLCEGCFNGYHTYCLDPPLKTVPENDWHCSKCLVGTGEFGFEDGGIYSLKKFQKKANDFREKHFASKMPFDPILNGPRPVTEDDVEREFWRLVSSLTETVEVEYGADIHSTIHGSGFPTIERNPRNPYSFDHWNLNNLPLNPDSLFRHIKSDISGMTVPWLYVGMVFSTFCWHNEDHYTYSANYQHFGATKTWYGIPGADAYRFEDAMREAVPELFESQPDLLFQLVTLLPPDLLRKAGVNVYALDQRAGQFVITFPQAYHAGFNHGFNFNEAVNFAPADWEPFGRSGIERLREFRRQPCFSHDELLLTAAGARDVSIKTARWLAPALQAMFDREKANRNDFESKIVDSQYFKPRDDSDYRIKFEEQFDQEDLPEEDYVCGYCKAYSYLSRFRCEKARKVACLDHIEMVNCCDSDEGHSVHYRIANNKLESSLQKVWDKAHIPETWVEKFEAAIEDNEKPQLKTLRSLLSEGEKIPWELPQLAQLRAFVDRCNDWVEEATNYITRKQQNRRKNEKLWRRGSQVKVSEMEEREKELRKLGNIKKLLVEADRLGFDCPEIATLQERADAIAEFQVNARDALQDIAKKTSQEIEDLIEVGKSFSLEIPEVEHLEKVLRQMKWFDKASERGQGKTLQDVTELIEQAAEINVPENNEHLVYLRDQKHRGEMWENKAKELMAVETIHFAQLDSFSKQALDLPVSKETLAAIDSILKKQREAQDQIFSLYERSQLADFRQRPLYKEVKEVMEALNELNSKPAGTIDLEKEQKRHEDWMRRGKKLFGKSNAPLHILLQHLEIVDNRNKACFDISDKPRMPVEPSSRANTPEPSLQGESNSSRDVFCLCRQPESGMMIECTVCHEWYHSRCLKIARGKVKEDDDFTCPICDHRVKIPRDAARPKLEQMIELLAEIQTLPFQPDEEKVITSIVDVAQDFRDYMSSYMESGSLVSTMEEVPTQRFYLRKIEGADILLADETNFFRQQLYRFMPIAPEAPPIIEVSGSTRKPRPTKQQKIMKEMGITDPEELPAHLRTKTHGKKRQDGEKPPPRNGPVPSNSSSSASLTSFSKTALQNQGASTINFRPPLTATAFPQRGNSTSHQQSPSLSDHPGSQSGGDPMISNPGVNHSFTSPSAPAASLAPLGSPFTANIAVSSPEGQNIDPSLFSNMDNFNETSGDAEELGDHDSEKADAEDVTMNSFDQSPENASSQTKNAEIEAIWAEVTNQDDIGETSGVVGGSEADAATGKASGSPEAAETTKENNDEE